VVSLCYSQGMRIILTIVALVEIAAAAGSALMDRWDMAALWLLLAATAVGWALAEAEAQGWKRKAGGDL